MNYLVIDTETCGLNYRVNPLLEIAMRLYSEDGRIINEFRQQIIPERTLRNNPTRIEMSALHVNRINPIGFPADDQTITRKIVDFLLSVSLHSNVILLGHNLQFDINFIEAYLNESSVYGWSEPFRHRKIDTCIIALFLQQASILKTYKVGLADLHYDLLGEHINQHHTAMGDVEATWAVYNKLMDLVKEKAGILTTPALENWKKSST